MKNPMLPLVLGALLASPAAYAKEGWYIGAGIGQATVEEEDRTVTPRLDFDDDDTAFKVYAGYKFSDYFAFEGQYFDNGEATDNLTNGDRVEVTADGFGAYALGILPATERFDLFGKIGVAWWDGEIKNKTTGFKYADESGYDLGFGFGASFDVTDRFVIRAEFEAIDSDKIDEVYTWMASVQWNF